MLSSHVIVVYSLIGLGAALGGMARFGCGDIAARLFGETFPWGTYLVNVLGSLFIGFFAILTAPSGRLFAPASVRMFIMVGLCGGFTTFSSFSLETLNMIRDGEFARASVNVTGTVLSCLVGVWLGYMLGTLLNEQ